MKIYLSANDVITDLHQRGYSDDFEQKGNEILWVQKQILLPADDFLITEFHRFIGIDGDELIIFGIVCFHSATVKGTLINNRKECIMKYTPMMERKMEELLSLVIQEDGRYCGSHSSS